MNSPGPMGAFRGAEKIWGYFLGLPFGEDFIKFDIQERKKEKQYQVWMKEGGNVGHSIF